MGGGPHPAEPTLARLGYPLHKMSMEARAWSRLRAWDPALKRLNELGLCPLECALEVSGQEVRAGSWYGIEPGEYWLTGESREHGFRIGSYSYWEWWTTQLRAAIPERAWTQWAPFLRVAGRGLDGGWGAGACAECLELWRRWEPEILNSLDPETLSNFERLWGEFRTGFELGSQGGALQIY